MEIAPVSAYRLEFAKRAEWRRDEERRALEQVRHKEEKDKKDERDREAGHEALLDTVMVVMATETEITEFNVKLDAYDTATIEALMENEEALADVRENVRIILDKAYVLPDGRKVFKTEDGTRVFDEHGEEVKDFDPHAIEDWRPKHEEFQKIIAEGDVLTEEREALVEFQEKLDEARENANANDGISKAELDELEKRLKEDAPEAVKRKLAQDDVAREIDPLAKPAQGSVCRPAGKLDMPTL